MDIVKKKNTYYSIKNQKEKDLQLLASKSIEKISDTGNAKKCNQFYLKKKHNIGKAIKKKLVDCQKLLKTQTLLIYPRVLGKLKIFHK